MADLDERPYRLAFPGFDPAQKTHPLAAACGVGQTSSIASDAHRFDRLNAWAKAKVTVVENAADADVAVYPHALFDAAVGDKVAAGARAAGVPMLFFRSADLATPVPVSYGTVYRDSIFASRMMPNERALPAYVGDPFDPTADPRLDHGPTPLAKGDRPRVGFCGYVGTPLRRLAFRLTGRREKVAGLILRESCLKSLERAERRGLVTTDFLRRGEFWAGAAKGNAVGAQREARLAFARNILDNHYTLCLRGAGNFSFRFYQVLSFGRIPLFLNTDCALPFDDEIDWRSVCAWAEPADLPRLGEVVADHFASLDAGAFTAAQHRAREVYERFIEPAALFQHILRRAMRPL